MLCRRKTGLSWMILSLCMCTAFATTSQEGKESGPLPPDPAKTTLLQTNHSIMNGKGSIPDKKKRMPQPEEYQILRKVDLVVKDSVFVCKTLWPDTEKDELVIFRNGEVIPIYTMYTADGSSVEFLFSFGDNTHGYACFEVYNAAADGSSFLFYTWPENRLYITYGIYMEFDPIPESVDLVKEELLLKKRHSTHVRKDTLDLGNKTGYFISDSNILRVECREIRHLP